MAAKNPGSQRRIAGLPGIVRIRRAIGIALAIGVLHPVTGHTAGEATAPPRMVECVPNTAGSAHAFEQNSEKTDSLSVSATGYGAPPPKYYPENQRRLMSMRAARIDAYRALAETVNGLRIWGGTTVGDMVVEKDKYRVFLDGYIRGARIASVTANEDGNYETVVEMTLDQRFLNQILSDSASVPCVKDSAQITFAPNPTPSTFYYSE
jgi:hypothetical protein